MKLVGQPENYSELLERVFVATTVTGLICTAALSASSPEVRAFLSSVNVEAEFGPIKKLKLLYLGIPLVVALLSRIFKLHDRLSDILRLRYWIDTRYILLPLAEATAGPPDETRIALIRGRRKEIMYMAFYPYVSLPDAKIDRQLVRSALDNLGWLWALVEAEFVVLLSLLVSLIVTPLQTTYWLAFAFSFLLLLAFVLWFLCKRTTKAEVDAIASDPDRHDVLRRYFESL
jgi:hypothetical protein